MGVVVAGHSSVLADMAGFRIELPPETIRGDRAFRPETVRLLVARGGAVSVKESGRSLPMRQVSATMMDMGRILDAICNAIEGSDKTRYRIAKDTGISQTQLSRLMSGERGLSIDALETLADYFGLEIVMRPKRRRRQDR